MNSSGIIYSTFPLSSRHSDRTGNDMPRCPTLKTAHSKRIQKNIQVITEEKPVQAIPSCDKSDFAHKICNVA